MVESSSRLFGCFFSQQRVRVPSVAVRFPAGGHELELLLRQFSPGIFMRGTCELLSSSCICQSRQFSCVISARSQQLEAELDDFVSDSLGLLVACSLWVYFMLDTAFLFEDLWHSEFARMGGLIAEETLKTVSCLSRRDLTGVTKG